MKLTLSLGLTLATKPTVVAVVLALAVNVHVPHVEIGYDSSNVVSEVSQPPCVVHAHEEPVAPDVPRKIVAEAPPGNAELPPIVQWSVHRQVATWKNVSSAQPWLTIQIDARARTTQTGPVLQAESLVACAAVPESAFTASSAAVAASALRIGSPLGADVCGYVNAAAPWLYTRASGTSAENR